MTVLLTLAHKSGFDAGRGVASRHSDSGLVGDSSSEPFKKLVRWEGWAVRVLLADHVFLGIEQRYQTASEFLVLVTYRRQSS